MRVMLEGKKGGGWSLNPKKTVAEFRDAIVADTIATLHSIFPKVFLPTSLCLRTVQKFLEFRAL